MGQLLITLIVGLLGGGTVATIVVAVLNRRKTGAETDVLDASASELAVRAIAQTVERLTSESERLDAKLVKAQADLEASNKRGEAFYVSGEECRAKLSSLTDHYATMTTDLAIQKAFNDSLQHRVFSLEQRSIGEASLVAASAATAAEVVAAAESTAKDVVRADEVAAQARMAAAEERAANIIAAAAAEATQVVRDAAAAPTLSEARKHLGVNP